MQRALARFFRDDLRASRAEAARDAEAFDSILFSIEQVGRHETRGAGRGLGRFMEALQELARRSVFFIENDSDGVPFERHYDLVRRARNDAFHQGAFARHLVENSSTLAMILEDALKEVGDMNQAQDLMVTGPVCAETWQPIQLVRKNMLLNSFSYLPVQHEGEWLLVSDLAIAKFIQGPERFERVRLPLSSAVEDGRVRLLEPIRVDPREEVDRLLEKMESGVPALVLQENRLLGILTPFDLL